ncbi:MAG: type III-A CRISPR-associated RAMP protein Csm4 [Leptospiraceae bacterium]|nr:type III-A CRISPR-associated RAMP protein Csm4 [Leptospiraceae bacterium]
MIKAFLAQIQLKTNLYTPMQGDTLFGMICWMILYREGEDVLTNFLQDSKNSPQAIFSSAFPSGKIPLPLVPKSLDDEIDYSYRKRLKKEKFISVGLFQKMRNHFSIKEFQESKISEYKLEKNNTSHSLIHNNQHVPHNTINRLTGMVEETDGFFFSKIDSEPDTNLDIYISVEEKWETTILDAFKTLGEYGFGKDSSTGGGAFEILKIEETSLFSNNFKHGITLSPIVPKETDPVNIFYDLFTRFGKIGSGSDIGSKSKNGFLKVPILMMKSGAFLSYPSSGYVGQLLENVHEDKRVKHSAYSIVLGFNLENSIILGIPEY